MQGAPKVARDLQSDRAGEHGRLRLRRNQRLTTAQQYDYVFHNANIETRRGPFRIVAASSDANHARLGMVVAKRNAPRAVDRNLVKRTIREWFRETAGELGPIDVVVTLRSLPKSRGQLGKDLRNTLNAWHHSTCNKYR